MLTDGLPRLNASTVFADGSVDALTGGNDTDWFFALAGQDTTDRRSGERLN